MTTVTSGLNWKGEPCEFYMNVMLYNSMTQIREIVKTKDFDYVSIVAGLPGMGKSNFAITLAKFCDENFNVDNIAFTADQFIEKTINAPKGTAIILDESFSSMNSKVSTSKDFLRIINHLQLIRQQNLFIILCLPNFFDLGKAISIYRSMHLFVVYGAEFGKRGEFACFNRDKKRNLYVKGIKYMNYMVETPNFRGKFYQQKAIDDKVYEKLKYEHLKANDEQLTEKKSASAKTIKFYRALLKVYEDKKLTIDEICEYFDFSYRTFMRIKHEYPLQSLYAPLKAVNL